MDSNMILIIFLIIAGYYIYNYHINISSTQLQTRPQPISIVVPENIKYEISTELQQLEPELKRINDLLIKINKIDKSSDIYRTKTKELRKLFKSFTKLIIVILNDDDDDNRQYQYDNLIDTQRYINIALQELYHQVQIDEFMDIATIINNIQTIFDSINNYIEDKINVIKMSAKHPKPNDINDDIHYL